MAARHQDPIHCRHCHRELGPNVPHACGHCGANVCGACGGLRDNPSGNGYLCARCHEAAVEWRARWHLRSDARTLGPLNV